MSDSTPSIPSDESEVSTANAPEAPEAEAQTAPQAKSNRAPTTTPEEDAAITRIDALLSELGLVQLSIAKQLAEKNTEIMEVERRHATSLDPKLIKAQDLFNELQLLSDEHRKLLLFRAKGKTYKRNVGTGAWRDQPRVELLDEADKVMETLRELGPAYSRPFIRRTISHEVNLEAMLAKRFRERVASIPGVSLTTGEDFAVEPHGGYRMSSAKPYWPALKDMPGPLQQKEIAGE